MRLLIVEHDDALRAVLARRLSAYGYAVDACATGTEGMDFAAAAEYDGMVLDIMLPGIDGLEMLRRLRAARNGCPVLLLTARDAVADRVTGLNAGADDYLVKPFAFDELLARVGALLRKRSPDRSPLMTVGDLQMDTATRAVTRAGRRISLTTKEFAMLEYLMRNAGQVLTREQIIDHVWNFESSFGSNLVDVYVGYLRGKIDKNEAVKLLATVRGAGYVLRAGE
jgi:DNA-binding response OmpR family regulator